MLRLEKKLNLLIGKDDKMTRSKTRHTFFSASNNDDAATDERLNHFLLTYAERISRQESSLGETFVSVAVATTHKWVSMIKTTTTSTTIKMTTATATTTTTTTATESVNPIFYNGKKCQHVGKQTF